MLAVAWLALCAQQLILVSATLSDGAFESALTSLAACAVWFAASRAAAAVGKGTHPSNVVACGAASSATGALLAFSGGGSWSYLLLFAHVALGCEVVARVFAPLSGRHVGAAAGVAGAGLVCAAAVHMLARGVAALLGSAGNVGFYAQVSAVFASLLPVAAALVVAVRTRRQPPPAPASEGPSFGVVVGGAALAVLFGLFAGMSMVFCGVVASPYQVDMLACGDRASLGAAAVGALVWACWRFARPPGPVCAFGLALLSVAGMLGGMVSYAVAADPVAPLPLAAIQAAGMCLIASAWALAAPAGTTTGRQAAVAALLVVLAVPARFLGFGVKHAVGLDDRTVTMLSLAATVALAVVLLVAVLALVVASFRALRAAEGERVRAVENVLEEMRHDSSYAREAMRQVYRDVLDDYDLSDREKEVAVLVLEGNGTGVVASIADISSSTVRFHLHNIYAKTGVKGKVELREKVCNQLNLQSR